ncbi:MAG: hypothetical protein PVI30_17425 [Myxococcales bacterium]
MTMLLLVLGCAGCATSFQGSARFPGGPKGCYDKCDEAGMKMTNFVYVGEYSTGCVCGLDRRKDADARARSGAPESAATTAAAVGVVMQMRRQQQQAAQQHHQPFTPAPVAP